MAPTVALVGCGRWGVHVLRDLRALGCSVPVVARGAASRERAIAGGADAVVGTVDELPDVSGIVVVTPTTTHADVLARVLERGVPVYVEKPLTDDARSAAAVATAAPERLFVMHKWRYHPGVEALAAIARGGELGPVSALHTTRIGWGNPHGDVDGVWMLAPHDLSIVLEILGEIPEPQAATIERSGGMTTGLVGLLGGGEPHVVVTVSIASGERRRELRLVCRDGVATLADPYADHVTITRGELQGAVTRDDEDRPISTEFPLLRELRAFVEHLEGGPPPRSSAADGAAEVAAIARLRALATGA
jgi:predicted dehydrogenase